MRQVHEKTVELFARREMLDLVVIDGKARGIIVRNLMTGEIERYAADAVILATGGYGTVYYLSTNAVNSNVTAAWRAHKRGALFANPCFTQIHPTCIPVSGDHQSKLTLMSESLRNDGRVWVPKKQGDTRPPEQIPEDERDYYLERKYPSFGNLVPRDVASRNAKQVCDEGRGVGESDLAVYLDFKDAIQRVGADVINEKYGNLFQMYQKITDEDPYKVPMRIYPAIHYTMGGLWVDYNLMSNVPGLHVLGEANFSDHGANRLGASALMQGLADGYFVIPYTIGDYLASTSLPKVTTDHDAFKEAADGDAEENQSAAGGERQSRHPRNPSRARADHVGRRRHGADRGEPEARAGSTRCPSSRPPTSSRPSTRSTPTSTRGEPMARLLMGEVGSGKTVVAVYAMLRALEAGYQAALMAPTETLAEQHAITLGRLLGGRGDPVRAADRGDAGARPAAKRWTSSPAASSG